jgi:hypothetical protein
MKWSHFTKLRDPVHIKRELLTSQVRYAPLREHASRHLSYVGIVLPPMGLSNQSMLGSHVSILLEQVLCIKTYHKRLSHSVSSNTSTSRDLLPVSLRVTRA